MGARDKDILGKGEVRSMLKFCANCEKFNKDKKECYVMKELIVDCWAWTDDKDWRQKVEKAVKQYRESREG